MFKIAIFTQAHNLFDLEVYISCVNPFFDRLSNVFDLSYHFSGVYASFYIAF